MSPIPLTLPLASNTAYCATAHTRDGVTTTTNVLRPLYTTTCIRQQPKLRTGGFCWSSFTARMPLLTATSTWRWCSQLDILNFSTDVTRDHRLH